MDWLPVMTLPDGTTVEMPMPPPDGTGQGSVPGYRVRGSEGVSEFATLPEVLDHLSTRGAAALEDPPTATSATPARERAQPLPAAPSGHGPVARLAEAVLRISKPRASSDPKPQGMAR